MEDLGYNNDLENYRKENNLDSFGVGRVISEHRDRYVVRTEKAELEAEIIGNLRFTAKDRSEFPAVGDWVAISEYEEDKALIHEIFPRKNILERSAVGMYGEKQIIATNIDFALIVQAIDRDFNLNRQERYLAISYNSGIKPILIFNKIDLIREDELMDIISQAENRFEDVPIVAISNETRAGYEDLLKHIIPKYTYCLLGSSGVGKSSLINNLSGKDQMKTGSISESSNRGKHITSHRELFTLENGGLMIDNPGMREVGMTDGSSGLEEVFSEFMELSQDCQYKDCTHIHEAGCAVLLKVENGNIDRKYYENYLKMVKERDHFESSLAEKKKKEKDLSKILKDYKKFRKKNK